MIKRLTARPFDWSGFLQRGLYEQVLLSATGVSIAFILLNERPTSPDHWLVLSPLVTILAYAFAFLRVWKSCVEDAKTADVWDEVVEHAPRKWQLIDVMLEPLYLLCVFMMPFMSIAGQAIFLILPIFYLVDWLWNREFLISIDRYYGEEQYNAAECAACPFKPYFVNRQRLTRWLLVATTIGAAVVWTLALTGQDTAFIVCSSILLLAMLVVEGVWEPWLNRGFHLCDEIDDEVTLQWIAPESPVDSDTLERLERMHAEAFSAEERELSIEQMAQRSGRGGEQLALVRRGDHPVGYLFCLVPDNAKAAFLWYAAIDSAWRRRGVGGDAIRRWIDELRTAPEPVPLILLESRKPAPGAPPDDVDRQRISFYQRLGFHRVGGIDYQLPAANQPERSIPYDVMLYPLTDPLDLPRVREAIHKMAAASLPEGDPRLGALARSLESLLLIPPPPRRPAPAATSDA